MTNLQWEETKVDGARISFIWTTFDIQEFLIMNTVQMTGRLPELYARICGDSNTIEPLGTFSSVQEAKDYCQQFIDVWAPTISTTTNQYENVEI
jgi:hypothetical protein